MKIILLHNNVEEKMLKKMQGPNYSTLEDTTIHTYACTFIMISTAGVNIGGLLGDT